MADARLLLEELVSTDGLYQTDEISDHIRNMIVSAFAKLGRQRPAPPCLTWLLITKVMGQQVRQAMQAEMQPFGPGATSSC